MEPLIESDTILVAALVHSTDNFTKGNECVNKESTKPINCCELGHESDDNPTNFSTTVIVEPKNTNSSKIQTDEYSTGMDVLDSTNAFDKNISNWEEHLNKGEFNKLNENNSVEPNMPKSSTFPEKEVLSLHKDADIISLTHGDNVTIKSLCSNTNQKDCNNDSILKENKDLKEIVKHLIDDNNTIEMDIAPEVSEEINVPVKALETVFNYGSPCMTFKDNSNFNVTDQNRKKLNPLVKKWGNCDLDSEDIKSLHVTESSHSNHTDAVRTPNAKLCSEKNENLKSSVIETITNQRELMISNPKIDFVKESPMEYVYSSGMNQISHEIIYDRYDNQIYEMGVSQSNAGLKVNETTYEIKNSETDKRCASRSQFEQTMNKDETSYEIKTLESDKTIYASQCHIKHTRIEDETISNNKTHQTDNKICQSKELIIRTMTTQVTDNKTPVTDKTCVNRYSEKTKNEDESISDTKTDNKTCSIQYNFERTQNETWQNNVYQNHKKEFAPRNTAVQNKIDVLCDGNKLSMIECIKTEKSIVLTAADDNQLKSHHIEDAQPVEQNTDSCVPDCNDTQIELVFSEDSLYNNFNGFVDHNEYSNEQTFYIKGDMKAKVMPQLESKELVSQNLQSNEDKVKLTDCKTTHIEVSLAEGTGASSQLLSQPDSNKCYSPQSETYNATDNSKICNTSNCDIIQYFSSSQQHNHFSQESDDSSLERCLDLEMDAAIEKYQYSLGDASTQTRTVQTVHCCVQTEYCDMKTKCTQTESYVPPEPFLHLKRKQSNLDEAVLGKRLNAEKIHYPLQKTNEIQQDNYSWKEFEVEDYANNELVQVSGHSTIKSSGIYEMEVETEQSATPLKSMRRIGLSKRARPLPLHRN